MKIKDIANKKNLHLAWSRITAGGNFQYKRLFRSIYYAYEIALHKNLDNLSERILGGSYTPLPPERVFIPKPSGLHRPLTLLHLEDQIVLQAFANLAALRMQKARSPLQRKCVFSNIVEHSDSPFFFLRWQKSYQAFQERIKDSFNSGMLWVGDFDLAAFYDTISHELLIKTIYPRSPVSDSVWILECLKVWSSNDSSSSHAHGLPQGPIASDYLAECFLLPVDKVMMNGKGYLRYVDDVRLLGASENKVRHDLVKLELCCKARGLIPQAGKFKIKKAENCEEAMAMLPSISDPQNTDLTIYKENPKHISSIFFKSIQGNPPQVADKTRLRYSLYRASIDTKILMQVLLLVKSHPEHTDALFFYIQRFKYRKQIEDVCLDVIRSPDYPA